MGQSNKANWPMREIAGSDEALVDNASFLKPAMGNGTVNQDLIPQQTITAIALIRCSARR
jgi:hypothetical protein